MAPAHSHGGETTVLSTPDAMPTIGTWCGAQPGSVEPHEEAAEIVRQVDFYFSDDNLHQDSHLLALTGGDGTGPVSLSHILSFSKMRKFKPKSRVREALKQSQIIEVVDSKRIQRRHPLTVPITVVPRLNDNRLKKVVPEDQPWMTKGMMKPTGFEPNATVGPITPKEHAESLDKYSSSESFINRIEAAVQSFNSKRTMHQDTREIFSKFMLAGGVEGGANMFQSGMTRDQLKKEGRSKEEIDQMIAYFAISESVKDAYYAHEDGNQKVATWIVDFDGLAKAFFSDTFMCFRDWYDGATVEKAALVLRNFYNYLLHHDVCPEYKSQLHAALDVCDLAVSELAKLAIVDQCLPGAFNTACSTLYGGSFAGVKRTAASAAADDDDAGWITVGDNIGLSNDEATIIFKAGIAAYGTDEQFLNVKNAFSDNGPSLTVVYQEELGLEVVQIALPEGQAKALYDETKLSYGYVNPMGKLICKRWTVPYAAPTDLPTRLTHAVAADDTFEFLVEAEVLAKCYPGIKINAVVKTLDIGIQWIDSYDAVFPSFYTWLPNECVREWKEPGEPKAWMKRQEEKKKKAKNWEKEDGGAGANIAPGEGGENETGEGEHDDDMADYSDEEPD